MSAATFEQVQRLVDQLSPVDQVRLMEALTARIAQVLVSLQRASETSKEPPVDAWEELFRVGDELAAKEPLESESMTATLLNMRR